MEESNYNPVSRRSDIILGASTLLVFGFFAAISSLESALAYSVIFGVFMAIVQTKPNDRRDKRFWSIIAILGLAHIIALATIRFSKVKFGLVSLPFALVDGFAMWGLINWIERRFPASKDASSKNDVD